MDHVGSKAARRCTGLGSGGALGFSKHSGPDALRSLFLTGAAPESIRSAFRSLRAHVVVAALFSAVVNLLYLTPTIYMMQVYDRVVPTGGLTTLALVSIAAVVAVAILAALDTLRGRLLVRAALRLDRRLAPAVLRQVIAPSQKASPAQAMRDLDHLKGALSGAGALAVFDAPWTPIYLGCGFLLHPALGVLMAVSSAVLIVLAVLNERYTRSALGEAMRETAASQAAQEGLLGQSEVVRALGMRDVVIERQTRHRDRASSSQASSQLAAGGYSGLVKFLRLILQSAALGLGAFLAVKGEISPGAIIAASVLMSRAIGPVEMLVSSWPSLIQARDGLRRLEDQLECADGSDAPRTTLPDPVGRVVLDKIFLRSPDSGRVILRDISLEVSPGETLGLIGPSGSGKTSLARIMAGAIEQSAGTIRFDGAEYGSRDSDDRARFIGYLPQSVGLFSGRIRDNISRFSTLPDAQVDEAVVDAARRAGAHEMILALPGGYDMELGPLGVGLSAGQAQRIGLARAFFGNPVLLVLDEPNSNLDQEGELALAKAIKAAASAGAAVVIVAHRAGILAGVDRLALLRNGSIQIQGDRNFVLAAMRQPETSEPRQSS